MGQKKSRPIGTHQGSSFLKRYFLVRGVIIVKLFFSHCFVVSEFFLVRCPVVDHSHISYIQEAGSHLTHLTHSPPQMLCVGMVSNHSNTRQKL